MLPLINLNLEMKKTLLLNFPTDTFLKKNLSSAAVSLYFLYFHCI